jgi:uncharacterized protein
MHTDELDRYLPIAEARQFYPQDDSAHDFDHVLRVTRLAAKLAQQEGADVTVVLLAALCHDLPTPQAEDSRHLHHLASADFAAQLLTSRGLAAQRVANVVHCIQAHRFRDQTRQPQTLEAQCLYDADKLDSIGAIGVARAFAFAGRTGERLWHTPVSAIPLPSAKPTGADYTPVHEFVYKLQKLCATLYTPTARQIGAERHAYLVAFFQQLDREMQATY